MLSIKDIRKRFGQVEALRGVSFDAPDGEITGLIGPNGAGKTTLMRILYTALKPDSGVTLVDGLNSATQRQEAQRRLGVLPDVRGLYPRLTGREHIRYFGQLHAIPPHELEQRTDRLVDVLGMQEFCDRRARGYSRGQDMKVALARALVHEPHNVLLDEPTNGLDVTSTRAVRELARGIAAEGRCVLLTSHVMSEVAALSDRIVVIAAGQVVMSGTQAELRAQTGLSDMEEIFMAAIGERRTPMLAAAGE